ncbi:uncharacterized protein YukE [Sinomonas atrocyanea]|uniref:hypothetical protein n=1 Tax=Sinomonas atrocyanea TaxID=37927 RepID=UPI00278252D7|nr:hypothetical protein [Sinomonas atrocyanea]MDP9886250.1 uncharacterized protein YukE [Sinomonas atrocyanea]
MGGPTGSGFSGRGSASGFDEGTGFTLPCGHDEAELGAAAAQLAAAHEELEGARAAVARAGAADWDGPAASAFKGTTASLTAQLAAIATALAGLALTVASLQSEAGGCRGAPSALASPATGAAPPRGLVVDGPTGPIVPLPSRAPALRLPAPDGPVFARGLPDLAPAPAPGAACR